MKDIPTNGKIKDFRFEMESNKNKSYSLCVLLNGEVVPGSEVVVDLVPGVNEIAIPGEFDVDRGDVLGLSIDIHDNQTSPTKTKEEKE